MTFTSLKRRQICLSKVPSQNSAPTLGVRRILFLFSLSLSLFKGIPRKYPENTPKIPLNSWLSVGFACALWGYALCTLPMQFRGMKLIRKPELAFSCGSSNTQKRAEYGFGEYGFKHRAQWVFPGSLSSGERAQWVPFSLLFVCQSELTEFLAELTEFGAELSEFALPKQYHPHRNNHKRKLIKMPGFRIFSLLIYESESEWTSLGFYFIL